MTTSHKIKFYFMNTCGLVLLLAPLLPWMSYGVGSKTGIDLGGTPIYILFISAFAFLLFSYISYVKKNNGTLWVALICSLLLFIIFAYEIIRITYQTLIAKSLPVEMFGIATLAANQIHVGYGLWIGCVVSLLASIVNFISIKLNK